MSRRDRPARCRLLTLLIAAVICIVGAQSRADELDKTALYGRWVHADNAKLCENPVDEDDQPFILTKSSIRGLEMGCEVTSWRRQGPFWVASAKCSGEGYEWRDDYYFSLTDRGELLVGREDGVVAMMKCKSAAAPPTSKDNCPLDHTVFEDLISGRRFAAKRMAEGCDLDSKNTLIDASDCSERNVSIIEGTLDGEDVVAVYEVWRAVPCCMWYSFKKSDASIVRKVTKWLNASEVEAIRLGDESYIIGDENPPFDPDSGPMAGGRFVPSHCTE